MNDLAIQQGNDGGLRELALFAGAGGGILGGHLLGRRIVCAVERNAYAAQVLAQRQNDGCLRPFPIWSDVTTFDPDPWRGLVDVVSGGFPCQDISAAGTGVGIGGERSGLWSEMVRIIRALRPGRVELENSPMLTARGLGKVLGDLAALGLDAEWGCISAASMGANHERDRIWIVATDPNVPQLEGGGVPIGIRAQHANPGDTCWWKNPPEFHRMDDEVAYWMDRLKAIGNGQVPEVAATAWRLLA